MAVSTPVLPDERIELSASIYSAPLEKAQEKYHSETESLKLKADECWKFFRPLISSYQVALGSPAAGPKNEEIVSAIRSRGTKGCCTFLRDNGSYVLQKFHSHLVKRSLRTGDKLFFCGGAGNSFLLYLDIDCHKSWQTAEDALLVQRLLECLGLPIYDIGSTRGRNSYLIVNRGSYSHERANEVLERLAHAICLLLAKFDLLADFELKGSVGYLKGSEWRHGSYGKLPIHHPDFDLEACKEKLGDGMSLLDLDRLATSIISQVPESCLFEMKRKKQELEKLHQPQYIELTTKVEAKLRKLGTWRLAMGARREDDGRITVNRSYLEEPIAPKCLPTPPASRPSNTAGRSTHDHASHCGLKISDHDDLVDESDSFKRQREALLRLCRRLKYVPEIDEALAFIESNKLFSGDWEDNLEKRRQRVQGILGFIARTFDPAKLNNGHVEIGKYDEWVKKRFPNGIGSKRRANDREGTVTCRSVSVSPEWISAALSILDFLLIVDPCPDGALPQERAKQMWIGLTDRSAIKEKWDSRKWLVLRETLVKREIIQITDRKFQPGKAMRWAVAKFFPFLGLWAQKAVKVIKGLGGVVLNNRKKKEHNTLGETDTPIFSHPAKNDHLHRAKPPPDTI